MSVAGQIMEASRRLHASVASLHWLQSRDAPHNFFDPSPAAVCPNLPNQTGLKRLLNEYKQLSLLSPSDLFPITRIQPALAIAPPSPFPSDLPSLPPPSLHLLCYWQVLFIAPRRPLVIDGVLHPPQERPPLKPAFDQRV
jgi:hypothetical protein